MNITAVNSCKPQPAKTVVFGRGWQPADEFGAPEDLQPVNEHLSKPKELSFEEQVLLNQQRMFGMLQEIKNNTVPKKPDIPEYSGH